MLGEPLKFSLGSPGPGASIRPSTSSRRRPVAAAAVLPPPRTPLLQRCCPPAAAVTAPPAPLPSRGHGRRSSNVAALPPPRPPSSRAAALPRARPSLLQRRSSSSPEVQQNLNNLLNAKDIEIARLREEIRILFAHWTNKTKELESQLEKHRRTDQELKKRVLKLEFCLKESQSQMQKLKRTGEKRDKALKELMDQVAMKQPNSMCHDNKENFWESQGFKCIASMLMLALVILAKR